jgi:hypothetical protein
MVQPRRKDARWWAVTTIVGTCLCMVGPLAKPNLAPRNTSSSCLETSSLLPRFSISVEYHARHFIVYLEFVLAAGRGENLTLTDLITQTPKCAVRTSSPIVVCEIFDKIHSFHVSLIIFPQLLSSMCKPSPTRYA